MPRIPKKRDGAKRQECLYLRISAAQHDLISRAASLRGSNVADFIVSSAVEAAVKTIRESECLVLEGKAREVFLDAVLNPAPPNQAAKTAVKLYLQVIAVPGKTV